MATRNSSASSPPEHSSTSLVWEAPHSAVRHSSAGRYQDVAAQLRSRPGQWAVIAEVENRSAAYSLKRAVQQGKHAFAPAGAFEALTRSNGNGVKVYARFTGGEAQS